MFEDFREIYLKYSDRIFRFLYWHLNDSKQAEDLTSEVFLKALKGWKKFEGKFLQAWLYRIAKNLLIDYYRSKKTFRLELAEQITVEPDFIKKVEQEEEINRLKQVLDRLPENLREVVVLRFFEEMSCLEVAKVLDISEGNVRVLQYRALKKLKEELE